MSKPALPAFFKTPLGLVVSVLVAILAICCGGSTLFGVLNSDPKPSPAVRIPQPAPATTKAAVTVTTAPAAPVLTTAAAPPPTTKAAPAKTTSAAKPACHPNYSACLPITGDLDCGEISQRNFRVVGGQDPYRLDADNDGIACES